MILFLCKHLQNSQNGFSRKEIIHNDNKSVSRIKTAGTKKYCVVYFKFSWCMHTLHDEKQRHLTLAAADFFLLCYSTMHLLLLNLTYLDVTLHKT